MFHIHAHWPAYGLVGLYVLVGLVGVYGVF